MSIILSCLFCRGLKYVLIREGVFRYLVWRYVSTDIRYFREGCFRTITGQCAS